MVSPDITRHELNPSQKLFADTMVMELVAADLKDPAELVGLFRELIDKLADAVMKDWVEVVLEKMEYLIPVIEIDVNFSIELIVVVVLLHCLLTSIGDSLPKNYIRVKESSIHD